MNGGKAVSGWQHSNTIAPFRQDQQEIFSILQCKDGFDSFQKPRRWKVRSSSKFGSI